MVCLPSGEIAWGSMPVVVVMVVMMALVLLTGGFAAFGLLFLPLALFLLPFLIGFLVAARRGRPIVLTGVIMRSTGDIALYTPIGTVSATY